MKHTAAVLLAIVLTAITLQGQTTKARTGIFTDSTVVTTTRVVVQSTNAVINFNAGDCVDLALNVSDPEITLTNVKVGKKKDVRVRALRAIEQITWPTNITWILGTPPTSMNTEEEVYITLMAYPGKTVGIVLGETEVADILAPDAITDLAAGTTTANGIPLTWTSPNGNPGSGATYDIRYATSAISENPSGGTPTFVAQNADIVASGNTITVGVDAGTGTNKAIVAALGSYNWGGETVSSVYNNTTSSNLTRVKRQTGSGALAAEVWIGTNTASGTNSITVTWTGSTTYPFLAVAAYNTVDPTTPTVNNTGTSGTSTAPSVNVTSTTGRLVADFLLVNANGGDWTMTAGAGQTKRVDYDEYPSYDSKGAMSEEAGAATTTMSWTLNSSQDWALIGFDLNGGTAGTAWTAATQVTGEPSPATAGASEAFTITGLQPSTTYKIRMKTIDGAGNISALSNEVTATTASGSSPDPGAPNIVEGGTRPKMRILSTSGSDGNAGTSTAAPWATFSYALAHMDPGDSLLVRGGTYHQNIDFVESGTSATSRITISRYGLERVIVDGAADDRCEVVKFFDYDYILMQGIEIQNQEAGEFYSTEANNWAHPYTVDIAGGANNIVFRYCRVVNWQSDVVAFYTGSSPYRGTSGMVTAGKNVTIDHCLFRGWWFNLLQGGGSTPHNTVISNDTSWNAIASNLDIGANDDPYDLGVKAILVESCILDTSWQEDNVQGEPAYITSEQLAAGVPYRDHRRNRGVVIRNTRMGNAGENAVDTKGVNEWFVYNNTVWGVMGDDDGTVDGGANDVGTGPSFTAGSEQNNARTEHVVWAYNVLVDCQGGVSLNASDQVFNNTMVNCRRTYVGTEQSAGGSGWSSWNKAGYERTWVNNVVVNLNRGMTLEPCHANWAHSLDFDYNLYVDSTGPGLSFYHYIPPAAGVTVSGLANWQSVLSNASNPYTNVHGKEANSTYTTAPKFKSANARITVASGATWPSAPLIAYDFSPKDATSPAYDNGRFITTAENAGGSSTLVVHNAAVFHGPMGTVIAGQRICIGTLTNQATIVAIDYSTNTITLDTSTLSWSIGDGVHWANMPAGTTHPHRGAR